MLALTLIVTAELVVLLRLLLPSFLAYAEALHDQAYGLPDAGDTYLVDVLNNLHFVSVARGAQQDHA